MLTGMFPFKGVNEKDLFNKISRGMFKIPETLDFEAKRLINKILIIDPTKRITAHDICSDRWVNSGKRDVSFANFGKSNSNKGL